MADRGEPRQDVESSRPPSGSREVSAVRSTDFLAGPRGLTRGERSPPCPVHRISGQWNPTTYGERNPSTEATCHPHCRMALRLSGLRKPFHVCHMQAPLPDGGCALSGLQLNLIRPTTEPYPPDKSSLSIPSRFMRESSVVRFSPNRCAAPFGPATTPLVSFNTRTIS